MLLRAFLEDSPFYFLALLRLCLLQRVHRQYGIRSCKKQQAALMAIS